MQGLRSLCTQTQVPSPVKLAQQLAERYEAHSGWVHLLTARQQDLIGLHWWVSWPQLVHVYEFDFCLCTLLAMLLKYSACQAPAASGLDGGFGQSAISCVGRAGHLGFVLLHGEILSGCCFFLSCGELFLALCNQGLTTSSSRSGRVQAMQG